MPQTEASKANANFLRCECNSVVTNIQNVFVILICMLITSTKIILLSKIKWKVSTLSVLKKCNITIAVLREIPRVVWHGS